MDYTVRDTADGTTEYYQQRLAADTGSKSAAGLFTARRGA